MNEKLHSTVRQFSLDGLEAIVTDAELHDALRVWISQLGVAVASAAWLYLPNRAVDRLLLLLHRNGPDDLPSQAETESASASLDDELRHLATSDVSGAELSAAATRALSTTLRHASCFSLSVSGISHGILIIGGTEPLSLRDREFLHYAACLAAILSERSRSIEQAHQYQIELAHERDRLKLLLEINNLITTHLDIKDVFYAAAAAVRRIFKADFVGCWLFDDGYDRLHCMVVDGVAGRKALYDMELPSYSNEQIQDLRFRTPTLMNVSELQHRMPQDVIDAVKSSEIQSIARLPVASTHNLAGLFLLGSRRRNFFTPQDLDILTPIASQIAMALDNAMAYEKLNASKLRLEDERVYLESEIQSEHGFEEIIGDSPALRAVLEQVAIVAPTDATVLLLGETGTGKELIARAIHQRSSRHARTFVRLNCAAIPSGLVESELFGHEKGAFTGALAQRRGRLELAHQGSLFLDEIGDIALELQPKLLRVLQEKEFERLGGVNTVRVDTRLIAATHRNLCEMMSEGSFREDLYYRLNVFPIEIPPLRRRREDIPLLVHYFTSRFARRMHKDIHSIPAAAMEAMMQWSWPGNIRELENFIERAVILTQSNTLMVPLNQLRTTVSKTSSLDENLSSNERAAIIEALQQAHGRVSGPHGAAVRLGIKRTTLQHRINKLHILPKDYR